MELPEVSLDDKFDLSKDRIFVTGTQAVVRLMLMQKALDQRAGFNTAGFVSGYRGSPLGTLDQQMYLAQSVLEASDVVFQPGINEELAATACWGTQQTELDGQGRFDGVFSLWYGKGPGVDRTGDVFRHGNLAGSSAHGGVLALMGDDHTAESSTNAHQTEFQFVDTMIPIFNPAGVQEIIDYGLYGFALSRFAGTWAALKCVKDNIESTSSILAGLDRLKIKIPEFEMPPGGLNIRPGGLDFIDQEVRLHEYKRAAASAFIRENGLNRIVFTGGSSAKLGIISVGKSYLDVRQSFSDLGIDEAEAERLGIRFMKIATPWPLDYEDFRPFVDGLDMVIVVEEKRSLIESQLREALYGSAHQPVIVGKRDEHGEWLFPVRGALDPNDITVAVGDRIQRVIGPSDAIDGTVKRVRQFQAMLSDLTDISVRTPYFCSGCPHNSSTKVPEGSIAAAGIGCHFMSVWMDRDTQGFTQMGGEGAQWVGQQPFSKRSHIFQNLGDGTYNHSGSLALRFALSAGADVTYKILYNDAVAMTGGQSHEGGLTVDEIARQVRAEGVERIALVSDEPDKYPAGTLWPDRITFHHRSEMDAVQRELRTVKGVSVLLYDQTCAAEKRRRRKQGTFPDPDQRVIINELVCEGCGDCGVQSNCVSVQPVETEFGRKRRIDQSSCNKDFSCIDGFCPSFVTVHGGKLKKPASNGAGSENPLAGLPDPVSADPGEGWACIVTGVGGTGVVTIGAVLGMAAHLESKGCGMIDMSGLAQKGGAVFSHIRIADQPDQIHAIRVPAGKADLVLGGDLVVSGSRKVLAAVREEETLFVANTAEIMPGDFTRNADFSLPTERLKRSIQKAAGEDKTLFFDGTGAAVALFGNAIAANMFLMGMAYQKGGLPLSSEALETAIRLNGQAVDMNISAFRWGRKAAHDPAAVKTKIEALRPASPVRQISKSVDELIQRRLDFLTAYQGQRLAENYAELIKAISQSETAISGRPGPVTTAAARGLFKLMAIKDEYEVARLYTDGAFAAQLAEQFESWDRLEFHLAPPFLPSVDEEGNQKKRQFGPWMMSLFGFLASLRRLRGTPLDLFGYQHERRMERRLMREYQNLLRVVAENLRADNIVAAAELLNYPDQIRGFGHVKTKSVETVMDELPGLKSEFLNPTNLPKQAAE